jgi:hypothetical protein
MFREKFGYTLLLHRSNLPGLLRAGRARVGAVCGRGWCGADNPGHRQLTCLLSMPVSSEFEAKLRTFHRQVFHGGLDALRQEGILRRDEDLLDLLDGSSSVMRRFIRGCHYGFDLAQRGIGSSVIDLETQIRSLTKQLKENRRVRDKKAELQTIIEMTSLRREQLVLRRLADGVLHHLVIKERWILRRTQLSDSIRPIDPEVLRATLNTAVEMNREHRECFHVVADLTTAAQIGDLIKISFSGRDPTKWEIIELKSGKVNAVLGELIEQLGAAAAELRELYEIARQRQPEDCRRPDVSTPGKDSLNGQRVDASAPSRATDHGIM